MLLVADKCRIEATVAVYCISAAATALIIFACTYGMCSWRYSRQSVDSALQGIQERTAVVRRWTLYLLGAFDMYADTGLILRMTRTVYETTARDLCSPVNDKRLFLSLGTTLYTVGQQPYPPPGSFSNFNTYLHLLLKKFPDANDAFCRSLQVPRSTRTFFLSVCMCRLECTRRRSC